MSKREDDQLVTVVDTLIVDTCFGVQNVGQDHPCYFHPLDKSLEKPVISA